MREEVILLEGKEGCQAGVWLSWLLALTLLTTREAGGQIGGLREGVRVPRGL